MKQYPSIDHHPTHLQTAYVFGKLDGSNMRAEWTRKQGWCKFGRRTALLDDTNPVLQEAPDLILAKYGDDLEKVFRQERWQKAIIFCEFWGPGSFAGNHADEPHTVTLFDVVADKRGFLEPKQFVKLFGHLDTAPLLHVGAWNQELAEQVRLGTFPGMPFEGVVVKGAYKSPGLPSMFKVKSDAWYEKLRSYCKGDLALFERMR